jgi:hypothetical protein
VTLDSEPLQPWQLTPSEAVSLQKKLAASVVPFTGAQGMLTLTVRVLDAEAVLFEAGGKLTCGDAGSTYELRVPVSCLVFRRPGVFVIEAMADGVAFARRELRVIAKGRRP